MSRTTRTSTKNWGRMDSSLSRGTRQILESLARAGVTSLPKAVAATAAPCPQALTPGQPLAAREAATPKPAATNASSRAAPRELPLEDGAAGVLLPAVERPAALQIIADEVAGCTRCAELVANRSKTVFGVGNPSARLCFMGEAPGADEDRQGIPFVGAAGQLLTKIIEGGLKMRRDDVYILNILKCRPPGNRQPAPDEAANCRGFLD